MLTTPSLRLIDWPLVVKVLTALITPAIAAITTYIAIAQYFINRRQYRLALFEKRMSVFNATMNMLASVMQSANPTLEQCFQFLRETRDHELLFGPEVGTFIDQIYKKATALHTYNAVGDPGSAVQRAQIMEWLALQMREGKKLFLKYLDFRKP